MNKRKQLSIQELREKQLEITRQLEAAEQTEPAKIGKAVQKLMGLTTLADINAKWQLIPRDSTLGKQQESAASEDEPFLIKDPFHHQKG